MKIEKKPFGKLADGSSVDIYTLVNDKGLEARITNYGGIIVSLKTPDRNGRLEDVVLGFETLADYIKSSPYAGSITGRYANRIAKARFTLEGKEYNLAANDKENCLHGGLKGFDKNMWTATEITSPDGAGLELKYLSKDGEEGFPGNLFVTVIYKVTHQNELSIQYLATTDKTTIINLTNHSYFNLHGIVSGKSILDHTLMLNADKFTPVNSALIPTGKLKAVTGTPLDFTRPTVIGERINQPDEQLKLGGGYDHNWVLNKGKDGLTLAARLYEPESGRIMETYTTEPGIQFYSGNFLDGIIKGKGGIVYSKRYALCLETQHYPDSVNQPKFPTTVLKPGEQFNSTTVYKFAVQ